MKTRAEASKEQNVVYTDATPVLNMVARAQHSDFQHQRMPTRTD